MRGPSERGQRATGIFAALGSPRVYDFVQDALGARSLRRRFVREFGLPKPARPLESAAGDARVRVLDVGCGTGRILEALGPCEYVGVDQSERYLEASRRRNDRPGARFVRADVQDHGAADPLGDAGPFDVALMFGLLHHLPDEDARRLVASVARRLAPGGRLLTLDGAIVPGERPVARLLLASDRGLHVRRPEEYRRLAEHAFHHVEVHVRRDLLRVPYTHAILECFVSGS